MPSPPPSEFDCRNAVEAMRKYGSQIEAAKALGIPRTTLQGRLRSTGYKEPPRGESGLEALVESLRAELDIARQSLQDATRPKFTIRQDNAAKSGKLRVLVIGDAHDSPHIADKSRFEWIGKHISQTKPDVVIQIGDFATVDSLNTHDANHTANGRSKPTFTEDMESFNLALQAIDAHLSYRPEMHVCLGNHERRIWAYENEHTEVGKDMQFRLFELFERYKWTVSPYGMITYYGGCGYVHAAINSLGKTFGGKNAEATIANESIHDLTVGHSHRERFWRVPKIGGNNHINIDNVGCYLPDQFIESYAQHAMNGWSYGLVEQEIRNGHIAGRSFIPSARLREMYS